MLAWLDRTGCHPAGPGREVYLRFGADASLGLPKTYLVDDTDPDYVTELQLPVSPDMATSARIVDRSTRGRASGSDQVEMRCRMAVAGWHRCAHAGDAD